MARTPVLGQRFDAIVFDWDGTAVPHRKADAGAVRQLVEALSSLSCDVAVVSGTHVGNIDGQLAARPAGPGRLHLCLNRGSEVYRVTADGVHLLERREASAREDRMLDRAAEIAIARLAACGLSAELVSSRLNRRKIDLIPEPEWADPPKARIAQLLRAVEGRLRQHQIDSLRAAVGIAQDAAREAGLKSARVTSDVKHVEIGLTDKSDSARWLMADLWNRGIGPGLVLVVGDEFGPLGSVPGSDSLLLVPEASRSVAVSVGVEPEGVPAGIAWLPGGPRSFRRLLAEQLWLRRAARVPRLDLDPDWTIAVTGLHRRSERSVESQLCLADGRMGTAGSPLLDHRDTSPRVLAAGVYVGQGPDTELLECPLWNRLQAPLAADARLRRVLDLRTGCLSQELELSRSGLRSLQFSSLTSPGTAALRVESDVAGLPDGPPLQPPVHRPGGRGGGRGRRRWMQLAGDGGGVAAAARDRRGRSGTTLERLAVFRSDPWTRPSRQQASADLDAAESTGFERLLLEQRAAWARRWSEADLGLDGDPTLQRDLRFALFHLIASVGDGGEAAVGARGVSGTAYRGHVFWDADVFVLPFLAATHPSGARSMLEYRLRRLSAAKEAARAQGRQGARFPWESALTGADVTPTFFRDHAGRGVAIRTGLLEEHIVADVAWAASTYWEWTGEQDFIVGPGRELLVETARYWASRIRVADGGRGHICGVIGPDEYHEAVDDNAYTNVMARWNLRRAARLAEDEPALAAEAAHWRSLAANLVDGYDPRTGLYEQFAGFRGLEPLVLREMGVRRPVAADVLLGAERVSGAQVVKQADVLMLHHLLPDEVAPGSLLPNLDFYEPRTAHGSSLSPGVHASLMARAGRLEEALELFRLVSRIDLDDVTGTTAGGVHLAAMGSLWQALVFGFGGVWAANGVLRLDPRLPAGWSRLEIPLRFQGGAVCIRVEPPALKVESELPITLQLPGVGRVRVRGRPLHLRRTESGWRV